VSTKRNVFLCHASEDKQQVVLPLRDALIAAGITCWLDEAEIHWGDSIVDKVTLGLRDSDFVIVVLSKVFVAKPWPRRELASALSRELSTGTVRVLPLIVGNDEEREFVLRELPLLHDKLHLTWDGDARPVIRALRPRLTASQEPTSERTKHAGRFRGSGSYCARCGASTGNPTSCTGGYTFHEFVRGAGHEFCNRCGTRVGSPTVCIGGYVCHSFIQGTGHEFCNRCGAKTGLPSDCTGGWVHHAWVQGTGEEFCNRCGAETGNASECTGGYVHHASIRRFK
jgi:hypothetical protein